MKLKPCLLACLVLATLLNASGSTVAPSPAKRIAEEILSTESVTIEFYSTEGKQEVTFSDPAWLGRLAKVLEDAPYYFPQSHCLCISYPRIHLRRKGVKMGTLSVHHDTKLRAYLSAASGDFSVGEATGRAVDALAAEKKPAKKNN